MDNDCHKAKPRSLGERIGARIFRGNLSGFTAEVLEVMEVVDIYQVLDDLDRTLDGSKRQINRAAHQLFEVCYPFAMMAPLGVLIAIQSRAAIKRLHVPTPAGSLIGSGEDGARQE